MSNVSTMNPAMALFKQRDDLQAFAAKAAYKAYYEARNKQSPNPCNSMTQVIKDTVKHYMNRKSYPEKTIEAFQISIADELVEKCNKHIFKVQEIASTVDDSMEARWRMYRGGKTKKSKMRKSTRKSKSRNNRR
jgi:hypothetical protein